MPTSRKRLLKRHLANVKLYYLLLADEKKYHISLAEEKICAQNLLILLKRDCIVIKGRYYGNRTKRKVWDLEKVKKYLSFIRWVINIS